MKYVVYYNTESGCYSSWTENALSIKEFIPILITENRKLAINTSNKLNIEKMKKQKKPSD